MTQSTGATRAQLITIASHIHQKTEVTGIAVENGRVTAVDTTRGKIATSCVLNCTAGWSGLISAMVGLTLPISTHPLQAAVTEPVRHFLSAVIVSGTLHVYVSQTDRGELVFGASVDPYSSYSTLGSLEFTEEMKLATCLRSCLRSTRFGWYGNGQDCAT